MDDNLRREVILENYKEPYNKGLVDDDSYKKINSRSDSCIDNLDFMMKINNNTIEDIRFDGEACAISTSAASILIRKLVGKTVDEAKEILTNYINMIAEKDYDEDILGELNVYDNIGKQPNRINCALLPSRAIKKLLGDLENER
jgi:nitrogen fixation NifU-like protein